ncbi:uncharacterized protein SCHCODRAFT_02556849 [Schizophyllum commune H4-8]|nr:uncharacterized protein SCHCODRAFT_02556849 [Schizophyllum commune H4-8]KAI5886209.1 hypothetical protein SCHCODRAFT_02556849 [Schizophyllum commune H4-8]
MSSPAALAPAPPTLTSAATSSAPATPPNFEESSKPHELEGQSDTTSTDSAGARLVSVYDIFHQKGGKAAHLLPLVTANRAASEVARDVLWERQWELANLLRTIPRVESVIKEGYYWVYVGRGKSSPRATPRVVLHLPAPATLTDAEYARFHDYARRIKVFDDFYDYSEWNRARYIIDSSLWNAVLVRGPLLPNVYALGQRGGFKLAFDDRYLCTAVTDGTEPGSASYPPSPELSLMEYNHFDDHCKRLATIAPFANIRYLSLVHEQGDPFEQIVHLRQLPSLEELHLTNFEQSNLSSTSPAPAAIPGFQALRTLVIGDHRGKLSMRDARIVLRSMSSQPLRLRTFSYRDFEQFGEGEQLGARRLYRTMRERVDNDTLTTLSISTGSYGNIRASRLFADLCAFKNVSRAEIYFNHELADVDDTLDVLSAAWTKLEHLTFVNRGVERPFEEEFPQMTGLTMEGLVPLARRCPHLKTLTVPYLDGEVPEPVFVPEREVLRDRRLKIEMRYGGVPDEKDDLIRFLNSVFPAPTLRFIGMDYGHSGSDEAGEWREFWDMMQKRVARGSEA